MSETNHPSADDLSALMLGVVDAQRTEEMLDHVEGCESCLAVAEAFWQEGPGQGLSALVKGESPDLPALEYRVLRRLHATQLAEQSADLASSGFLYVVLRLMAPLFFVLGGRPSGRRLP
jgi:hypothetical protein